MSSDSVIIMDKGFFVNREEEEEDGGDVRQEKKTMLCRTRPSKG